MKWELLSSRSDVSLALLVYLLWSPVTLSSYAPKAGSQAQGRDGSWVCGTVDLPRLPARLLPNTSQPLLSSSPDSPPARRLCCPLSYFMLSLL